MNEKERKKLFISLTIGIGFLILTVYFFYLYFDSLFNLDYDNPGTSIKFGYLIAATVFMMLGLLIIMIPNQKTLRNWGLKKSFEAYSDALEVLKEKESSVGGTVLPPSSQEIYSSPLYCSHCGRKIPEDANICPYCGKKVE